MSSQHKWDKYFMGLTYHISLKSIDPSSKFGCVAVDDKHGILSTGYNGPPRGVDDDKLPLWNRPIKYTFMEHAERNCIYNAARRGISLEDCTFYINGIPCKDCLRAMYQVGAKKIVYTSRKAKSFDQEDARLMAFLSKYIVIKEYKDEY